MNQNVGEMVEERKKTILKSVKVMIKRSQTSIYRQTRSFALKT